MTSAPEFLDYILKQVKTRRNEFTFIDNEQKISKYLEHLYSYELNRFPKHRSFERNYRLNYFDKEKMLAYYLDPYGEANIFVSFRVKENGDKEFYISKK